MKRLALGPILGSMALGLLAVKAQTKDLPTANKAGLKDSVKDAKSEWPRFVRAVIDSGEDFDFADGLAQAIGLAGPSSSKDCNVTIQKGNAVVGADRDAYVVYSPKAAEGSKRPLCVYLYRGHWTKRELKLRYYRFSLDGKLEQAITLQNKRENGKDLPETRARFEEDIQNPEIQKAFKTEMAFWLKDWLKKHRFVAMSAKDGANPEDGVRISASKETKALDQEAAAVPAAPPSAPSPQ